MFVGEGATAHRLVLDGQSISSSSVQSVNNKMPVSSVFNDSEGLYRTTVCLGHVSERFFFLRYATEMP